MSGYVQFGPWGDGSAPGISAEFLNPLETFLLSLNSASYDSDISANGSGVATLVGLIANASGITDNGPLLLPYPTAQTLSNSSTITLNTGPLIVVTNSGNVTGIIMTAGNTAGQVVFLYNFSSSGTVTFAASGSRVRNGSNIVLSTGHSMMMIWDGSNWTTCP